MEQELKRTIISHEEYQHSKVWVEGEVLLKENEKLQIGFLFP